VLSPPRLRHLMISKSHTPKTHQINLLLFRLHQFLLLYLLQIPPQLLLHLLPHHFLLKIGLHLHKRTLMKHKIRLHLTHIHTPIRQMLSEVSLRLIYRDQRPNPPISSFILYVLYLRLCFVYDDHLGHSLFLLLLD
jgi:hypothetical protein